MKITIYCENPDDPAYAKAAAALADGGAELVLLPSSGCGRTIKTKTAGSVVYFDAASLSIEKIAEFGSRLSEPWGVIDRKGAVADPASLFHSGASDYLGPGIIKKPPVLVEERLKRLRLRYDIFVRGAAAQEACDDQETVSETRKKLPQFPGWDKLKQETAYPFTFVFAALGDQQEVLGHIGEKRLDKLRSDFAQMMETWAEEHGGKLWIRDAATNLILFPAAVENTNPILNLIKLQLNRALISYESFRMEIPIRFRFAVHSGDAPWRKPGSTGTVVSEHVNFIYHLGMKAVGDGTIGVSDKAFGLIPAEFADFFKDGPVFEDHKIRHSRVFN